MNTMTRRLAFPLLTAILLLPGCALLTPSSTVEAKAADARRLCYAAASIGTAAALDQNAAWKPAFELAYNSLKTALADEKITGDDLRQILSQLPVKELKSRTAMIAIEAASMLFDTTTGKPVDLTQAPVVLAAAHGILDGMGVGLGK